MKVMTILGTRPEIIRLSLIIPLLDQYATRHVLVHTGQNFTNTLSGVFFSGAGSSQSGLRPPGSPGHAWRPTGRDVQPDGGNIGAGAARHRTAAGDTNSALCAVLAERLGYPVVHMEAGNRCFDLDVPEEKNRKVIDAVSSINMPYTSYSKNHLLREGVPSQRIVQTGTRSTK